MRLDEELKVAKEAIAMAGSRVVSIYKEGFDVIYKEDETPVTKADLESDTIILKELKKFFPEHAYLTEESADDRSRLTKRWCWIIDPLDGTKEFVKRNDEFAINIALAFEGQIVLGLVYAPIFDELYYAIEGHGAIMERNNQAKSIRVSTRLNNLRILKSRSHNASKYSALIDANVNRIQQVTRMGSSLKGCKIASGEFDAYYNFGKTMLWDTAPVELIVKEAGGYFAQTDGTHIDYRSEDATNKKGFIILNHKDNMFKL